MTTHGTSAARNRLEKTMRTHHLTLASRMARSFSLSSRKKKNKSKSVTVTPCDATVPSDATAPTCEVSDQENKHCNTKKNKTSARRRRERHQALTEQDFCDLLSGKKLKKADKVKKVNCPNKQTGPKLIKPKPIRASTRNAPSIYDLIQGSTTKTSDVEYNVREAWQGLSQDLSDGKAFSSSSTTSTDKTIDIVETLKNIHPDAASSQICRRRKKTAAYRARMLLGFKPIQKPTREAPISIGATVTVAPEAQPCISLLADPLPEPNSIPTAQELPQDPVEFSIIPDYLVEGAGDSNKHHAPTYKDIHRKLKRDRRRNQNKALCASDFEASIFTARLYLSPTLELSIEEDEKKQREILMEG